MNKKTILTIISLAILLAGCGQKPVAPIVEISPEVKVKEEANLAKYSKLLAEFKQTPAADLAPANSKSDKSTPATTPAATQNPPLEWYVGKSTAESTLGKNDAAIKTLNEALSKYPDDNVLLNNLGKIYDMAYDCETAKTYYQKLIDKYGMDQYYYTTALCYMHVKDKDNTIKYYDAYKKIKPTFSDGEIDDFLSK